MKTRSLPAFQRRAFTLIELLVVMSIIVLIGTFVAPTFSTILKGSQVTQASTILTDQLSLARQEALSRNESIEVRFIQFADPETPGETAGMASSGHFRAIQLMAVTPGGLAEPLSSSKLQILPNSIMINPSHLYSTILSINAQQSDHPQEVTTPTQQDPSLPRNIGRNYNYVPFRFLANGSTDLTTAVSTDGGTTDWFVTIHSINDLPKLTGSGSDLSKINFFTLAVDPVSGETNGYRPNAK